MPRGRVVAYSTTLPSSRLGWRRGLGYTASVIFHIVLVILLIRATRRSPAEIEAARAAEETARPIQLVFAPPRPTPTPRPAAPPLPPAVPITPGPDRTPGAEAHVTPTPEPDPNAVPNTPRVEATRPDPGDAPTTRDATAPSAPPPTAATPPPPPASVARAVAAAPTMESEAQRLFGRPSSKLGPVSGSRDNRPWETPVELSRGCEVPPSAEDSTLPPGMGVVIGRIYNQDTGEPLSGARLQIIGTQYGTFANERGEYRLYFDRKLVNRCQSQQVRVSAPGYRQRDVTLYIGETPNGDVPLSRY